MYVTAYNTTDQPLIVDDEGRTVGGSDWGTVDTTADAVKAALDAGVLVKIDPPAKGSKAEVNPAAADAFARTEEVSATAKGLSAAEPDRLAALADTYAPDLAGQNKTTLVAGLAARGVKHDAAVTTTSEGAE